MYNIIFIIYKFYNFHCTNSSTLNHKWTKLRQFYYIMENIKRLKNCFMQLCTTIEGRNMYEMTCYAIIAILKNCLHLLVYTVVIKSIKFVTCQGPRAIYIAVQICCIVRHGTIK